MDEAAVGSLLERSHEKHGYINTLVHASGVLHNGLLHEIDSASVRKPFGPKASGAWYLHKHAAQDEIWHFVMYLSVSTGFGNPGLCRSENLPGESI